MTTSKPELSIIILSYNVRDLLLNCLKSIYENKPKGVFWQIIVVDNASTDDSVKVIRQNFPQVEVVVNESNLGFSKGNNRGIPKATADVVLFLNPDTVIVGSVIQDSLSFLQKDPKVGALTCRVDLPNGELDYSCHRGLPTPWNSLCYFTGLAKVFPKVKLFAGYTASYLDINKTHEIDCGNGTFLMIKREAGEEIGWWDTDYFWNGEDIEFCYRLKQTGWRFFYFAEGRIIHYKGSSSGLWSTAKTVVPTETRVRAARSAAQAMRIFYKKHYYPNYPPLLRNLIMEGINLLERYRLYKINQGLKYA